MLFPPFGKSAEPIGALWEGLRMGMLCSCASARNLNRDKAVDMLVRGDEMDAQVVGSG